MTQCLAECWLSIFQISGSSLLFVTKELLFVRLLSKMQQDKAEKFLTSISLSLINMDKSFLCCFKGSYLDVENWFEHVFVLLCHLAAKRPVTLLWVTTMVLFNLYKLCSIHERMSSIQFCMVVIASCWLDKSSGLKEKYICESSA